MSISKTETKRRRIPLRLRITILFTLLLVAVTGILTAFSIMNNTRAFSVVPMEKLVMSTTALSEAQTPPIKATEIAPARTDQLAIPAAELEQVTLTMVAAERGFRNDQIVFLVITIAFGAAVVYWLVGRALRPLTSLSGRIAEIDAYRLDEKLPESATGDELASLVRSFNSMLTRLEESFSMQKQFSANAAHELKTPLATMKASLQVLALDEQPTSEDYRENTELMARRVDQLIEIVQNLLLLSAQECCIQDKIPLRELIRESLCGLQPQIDARNLHLQMQMGAYVLYGDRSLLATALRNLFSNSVKYSREGGFIQVRTEAQSDELLLIISDNGGGVASEELPHLFEPFYRAASSRSGIEGSGMGLAIVKAIIEKHGGGVAVESCQGEGLQVMLTFPKGAFEPAKAALL